MHLNHLHDKDSKKENGKAKKKKGKRK